MREEGFRVELVNVDLWNTVIGEAMLDFGVVESQFTCFVSGMVNLGNGLVYICKGVDVMGSNTS